MKSRFHRATSRCGRTAMGLLAVASVSRVARRPAAIFKLIKIGVEIVVHPSACSHHGGWRRCRQCSQTSHFWCRVYFTIRSASAHFTMDYHFNETLILQPIQNELIHLYDSVATLLVFVNLKYLPAKIRCIMVHCKKRILNLDATKHWAKWVSEVC